MPALTPAQHAAASWPLGAVAAAQDAAHTNKPIRATMGGRLEGGSIRPAKMQVAHQTAGTQAAYTVNGMPCPDNITRLDAGGVMPDVGKGDVTLLLAPGTYVMYNPKEQPLTKPVCIIGRAASPSDVIIKLSFNLTVSETEQTGGLSTSNFLGLQMITMDGQNRSPGVFIGFDAVGAGVLSAADVDFRRCYSEWPGTAVYIETPATNIMRRVAFLDNNNPGSDGALALANTALEAEEVRGDC